MKNLSGGENEAENPIIAEFKNKWFYPDDRDALLDDNFYEWLKEKLASEYARGVREVIEEVEKKCEIMKYKIYCDGVEQELIEPSMIGYVEGLTDLQTFLKTIKL